MVILILFVFLVVRTILLALRDHFTTDDKAAIGYLDYPSESRKELARKSRYWKCKLCPYAAEMFNKDEKGIETRVGVVGKNDATGKQSETYLLWVGAILLILSIAISYTYLYLI